MKWNPRENDIAFIFGLNKKNRGGADKMDESIPEYVVVWHNVEYTDADGFRGSGMYGDFDTAVATFNKRIRSPHNVHVIFYFEVHDKTQMRRGGENDISCYKRVVVAEWNKKK